MKKLLLVILCVLCVMTYGCADKSSTPPAGVGSTYLRGYKAVAAGSKNEEDWLLAGNGDMQAKDYAAALRKFEAGTKLNPNNPMTWIELGRAYGYMGKKGEAIRAWSHVKNDPNFGDSARILIDRINKSPDGKLHRG